MLTEIYIGIWRPWAPWFKLCWVNISSNTSHNLSMKWHAIAGKMLPYYQFDTNGIKPEWNLIQNLNIFCQEIAHQQASEKHQAFCSGLYVINTCHDNIKCNSILVTEVTGIYWYNRVIPLGLTWDHQVLYEYTQKCHFVIALVDHKNTTDNSKSLTNLTTLGEKQLKIFLPNNSG